MVSAGRGKVSSGSVKFNLVKDEYMTPWTGSGSYYLMLVFDQDDDQYYYTNGQTISISEEDENFYAKLPKYNITSATSTIAFNLFKKITLNQSDKPAAPSGLTAGTITSNSIAISWNSVSGVSGYTVYAGTSSGNMTQRGTPTNASFTITGLTANTVYYIAVSARNADGEGAQSSPITATTANTTTNPSLPAAPSDLVSVTKTDTTIAISWNGVSGATGYHVYAGTTAGNLTLRGSPTTTSYLIEGLTPNTTYYIAVSAENEAGEGEKSAPITVTTNQSVKPATPSGLATGVITENSIAVSWNSVGGVSGYKVFAGTTIDDMELRGSPTGTSFTITGLTANTTYWIAVSALTASSESEQSASVNAITIPVAPAGLAAGTITSNSITVSWTPISGISYTVYAGTSSENMTQRGTTSWDNSFTITGLQANTVYYITISATNASGESSKSSPITATTKLPAPSGLTANPITASNTIQLSWNALVGAASYNVYRSSSATGTYTSIGTTPGISYNDTGVTPGDNYYYKVSSLTSGNVEGDISGYVAGRIPTTTKAITKFGFVDFPSVNGTISGPNISVTVPNIVNLTTLVPTITHNGKSISPAPDEALDFTSPKQYRVTADDGTYQDYTVTVTVTDPKLATAFSWIFDNKISKTYTIVVQANESLAPVTINASSSTYIILSGGTTEKTISLSSDGSLFTINVGTLTLENNITLQGRSSNNASLVRVNSSGKLVMNAGSKIQNNTVATANNTDAFGGGVYINGGTFTMDGGTISGNKVQAGTSGSYSSTDTRAKGGGVYLNTGTFTMNGGTISNNTAYSAYYPSAGGGVYVAPNRTFTMNGGTISGNIAESSSIVATSYTYGGGVFVDNSTFTMKGGTISGNTAKTASYCYGGGVYVSGTVTFTKTGGTIYGSNASPTTLQNTAKNTDSGHAVYAKVGSTTLKRNTTAGTTVNMDSGKTGSAGGWE